MTVSSLISNWIETTRSEEAVGTVVHTLDGKTPVRAEKTADGWVYTEEPWPHA